MYMAVKRVIPDLETPGKRAKAWAVPIMNAWLIVISLILKTFLVYLHTMPEQDLVDVPLNTKVMGELLRI